MWLFDPKQIDLRDNDLTDLEEELEEEDAEMVAEMSGEVNGQAVEVNNAEGWVDEVEVLSDVEQRQLQASIRPIRLAVGKVSKNTYLRQAVHCPEQLCKLAFKVIHSTTIILSAWREIWCDLHQQITLFWTVLDRAPQSPRAHSLVHSVQLCPDRHSCKLLSKVVLIAHYLDC